jgi:hypothetical protein
VTLSRHMLRYVSLEQATAGWDSIVHEDFGLPCNFVTSKGCFKDDFFSFFFLLLCALNSIYAHTHGPRDNGRTTTHIKSTSCRYIIFYFTANKYKLCTRAVPTIPILVVSLQYNNVSRSVLLFRSQRTI